MTTPKKIKSILNYLIPFLVEFLKICNIILIEEFYMPLEAHTHG